MKPSSSVNLLTINEAAELLRQHPNSIRNAIAQGRLNALRVGRGIRINEQDLLGLITPYKSGEFGCWRTK